jgi:hypothetical protein
MNEVDQEETKGKIRREERKRKFEGGRKIRRKLNKRYEEEEKVENKAQRQKE